MSNCCARMFVSKWVGLLRCGDLFTDSPKPLANPPTWLNDFILICLCSNKVLNIIVCKDLQVIVNYSYNFSVLISAFLLYMYIFGQGWEMQVRDLLVIGSNLYLDCTWWFCVQISYLIPLTYCSGILSKWFKTCCYCTFSV